MLILVAIIVIILFVLVTKILILEVDTEVSLCALLTAILLLDLIGGVVSIVSLERASNVDEQIATLQQENADIEETTYSALQYYLEHEENKYKDLEIEKKDTMALISVFPEVEAIAHGNIEKYNENLESLNDLQDLKESIPTLKWLLYFGS